jgi:hypothetical protein
VKFQKFHYGVLGDSSKIVAGTFTFTMPVSVEEATIEAARVAQDIFQKRRLSFDSRNCNVAIKPVVK